MRQHFKERKNKGGRGGSGGERELKKKKKTNINREKKERKEVIEFFCLYGKLVKQKERYIFQFQFIEKRYTFFSKKCKFFFPFFGERSFAPRSRREQPLG